MKPNLLNRVKKITGAVDNHLVSFDGNSGELLKDSALSASVLSIAIANSDTGVLHTADLNIHVTKELKDMWTASVDTLSAHIISEVIHVTAEDKILWTAKETTAGSQAKANAVQTNLNVHQNNTGVHTTQQEKNLWNNTYSRNEIDNMISNSTDGSEWKIAVDTYADIATTYPNPLDGWKVTVNDTDILYLYTGTEWIAISSNTIPLATSQLDGKMTALDKIKLDTIENGANNYIHPSDILTRHVTDAEKLAWNGKASSAVATEYSNGLLAFADKIKLNTVELYANYYSHPEFHSGAVISQDSTHRFITDLERKIWNEKAPIDLASSTTAGLMSITDKLKIETIAEYANRYIHPDKHTPDVIVQDYLNRFVTDVEKTTWNNKETITNAQAKATLAETNAKTYTDTKIQQLMATAPEVLNTFTELANALNNDPNFANTLTLQLANKLDESIFNTHVLNSDIHFTTTERTKLGSIADNANFYVHPTTHSANMIEQTATRSFISDTERTDWNNKASTSVATIDLNGLMSADDKAKLESIEPRAEENVQSDWDCANTDDPAYVWNKPTYMFANGGDCDTIKGKTVTQLIDSKKLATIIIGTSTNSHTNLDADYICDGVGDYNTITDAINALPESGGKLVIRDGSYNIKLPIIITKNNIIIEGFGNSTKFIKDFDSTEEGLAMIKVTGANVTIRDIQLTSENYNTTTNILAYITGNYNTITDCTVAYGGGIYIYNGSFNIIKNNIITTSANRGVYIRSESTNCQGNKVDANTFINCVVGVSIASTNTYSCKNNNIVNNNIYNCSCGIRLSNTASNNNNTSNNIVSNNNITKGNGSYTDYSATEYTINLVNGVKNLITNNILSGKDVVNTSAALNNIINSNIF